MFVADSKRSRDAGRRLRVAGVAALLALSAVLSGCASFVSTDFTAYHAWPAEVAQPRYRFVSPPHREQSLEQAAFETLARPVLADAGFVEAPDSRFGVSLAFSEARELRTVRDAAPMFRPYFAWGWPGPYAGWGFGLSYPWGWQDRVEPIWRRTLRVEITDLSAVPPRRVWEAGATSEGYEADAVRVMPVMLREVLAGFPGESGKARRATSELPPRP